MRRRGWIFVVLVLALIVSVTDPASARQNYRVIDLGTGAAGTDSFANDINNRDEVVTNDSVWYRGDSTTLGDLIGVAINDHGAVLAQDDELAVVVRDGIVTDLGRFTAVAMNNRGQVAGYGPSEPRGSHAVVWENGRLIDLGTFGGQSSFAFDINAGGTVVGESDDASGQGHGFVWRNGRVTDLGDFSPRAINDAGLMAGYYHEQVVLWRDGPIAFLPSELSVNDINNRGQVTGVDNNSGSAFVWERGTLTELPELGLGESSGRAINDRGTIAGYSETEDRAHPVLWTRQGTGAVAEVAT